MAWRIVRQPNGHYARYSDIVDDFTHYDMTEKEAIDLCRGELGEREATEKVHAADVDLKRYFEAMETIELIHGPDERRKREKEIQ